MVFAVSKRGNSSSGGGTGTVSTLGDKTSATTNHNSNILTKKELSSLISCLTIANKSSEGLAHKVVTNCLDTANGITPTTPGSSVTGATSNSASSSGSSTTS
ncbi:MAG TPA: hypothetical protein VJ729_02870 [Nitrososphaeraceae archaeon]|nr:hypothetical protein [Nitrososphaeraceae archaeon]